MTMPMLIPQLPPWAPEHLGARGRISAARKIAQATTRILLCLTIIALSLWGGAHPTAAAPSDSWQQLSTAVQPPARSQYGMAADSAGHVYIYGGRGADGAALGDFWLLRPADGA